MIPLPKKYLAKLVAQLFFDNWVRHRAYPWDRVSDRDKVFQTLFWQHLMRKFGINLVMTTAFHPVEDGQTERVNQVLNMFMRSFCEGD